MRNNIFLLGIASIFIFSACTPDDSEKKWLNKKLSKIVKDEQHKAITKSHNSAIYGVWYLSNNQHITLQFSDEGIWQYHQKSTASAGGNFSNGNNFTMSDSELCIYKKDGEIITGKYELSGQNSLKISEFCDNRFNGSWIKK